MDSVMAIRLVAGVIAVIVLGVIVMRRRQKALE